jgi:hypothetical protein
MAQENDFLKEEEIELLDDCYVNGSKKKKGTVVKLSGNDKAQLLGSGRGKRVEPKAKEEKK